MTKANWIPVFEMDLDDGTHTCYVWETDSHFCYLTQMADNTWDVELLNRETKLMSTIANCKTLVSAKRWFSRYCL